MASFNFESDSEQLAPLAPLTVSYPIIPDIPQDLKEEIQHLMWAFMQFLSSNSNSNTNTDNEVSRAKNGQFSGCLKSLYQHGFGESPEALEFRINERSEQIDQEDQIRWKTLPPHQHYTGHQLDSTLSELYADLNNRRRIMYTTINDLMNAKVFYV